MLSWDLEKLQGGLAALPGPRVPQLGPPGEGCCGLTGLPLDEVQRLLPVYTSAGSPVGFTVRTLDPSDRAATLLALAWEGPNTAAADAHQCGDPHGAHGTHAGPFGLRSCCA